MTQPVGELISSNFPHPSTKKEVALKKLLEQQEGYIIELERKNRELKET